MMKKSSSEEAIDAKGQTMLRRRLTRSISPFLVALVVAALLATGFGGRVTSAVLAATQASVLQKGATEGAVIHYQGRLLEPTTGQAKPDGAYTMSFSLYTSATGGGPLWTENKSVAVDKGLFSTLLGDITPFASDIFNGQPLYLGITVSSDPETTPRQQIAHVAYAMRAATAGQAETAITAETATTAETASNADTLDSLDSSQFALADHNHDGRYYLRNMGTQYHNTLTPGQSITIFTFGWPVSAYVQWYALPTTTSGQVTWSVKTELGSDGNLTYYITTTNVGTIATGFDVKFVMFQ